MKAAVVDASVIAAAFFPEPHSETARSPAALRQRPSRPRFDLCRSRQRHLETPQAGRNRRPRRRRPVERHPEPPVGNHADSPLGRSRPGTSNADRPDRLRLPVRRPGRPNQNRHGHRRPPPSQRPDPRAAEKSRCLAWAGVEYRIFAVYSAACP